MSVIFIFVWRQFGEESSINNDTIYENRVGLARSISTDCNRNEFFFNLINFRYFS